MKHWLLSLFFLPLVAMAQTEDIFPAFDRRHIGGSIEVAVGNVLKADPYEKMWLHQTAMFSVGGALRWHSLPSDSHAYAADFNYPTLSAGLMYGNYRGVTMRKYPNPAWGLAVPVDYTSRMGHTLTAFLYFERPLWRLRRWEVGYSLGTGLGFATHIYNKHHNVDNEMLGSHWNIFFGAGVYASYRFTTHWVVRTAIDFRHLSNGATARPNKGVNTIAPSLSLLYTPPLIEEMKQPTTKTAFRKRWSGSVVVGVGGKVLLDDWLIKQYQTPPTAPDYRQGRLHFFPSYSLQSNLTYRYARRWASGIGLDLNYATAANHIRRLNRSMGSTLRHSPWSVGVAARHEVFYGHLSMSASLGLYLFRHMGETAAWEEKPYYERIGLRYRIPHTKGLFVGVEVKAHSTKADFTEFLFGMDF